MKILVAVDGSEYTRSTLDLLGKLGWFSPTNEITIFTAVPPIPHRAAAFADPGRVQSYYDDDAQLVLRPISEELSRRGVTAAFAHEVGNPAECIARSATRGRYDLIAMGSHGKGALGNLVTGSVAAKVLASCKVPVLLVR